MRSTSPPDFTEFLCSTIPLSPDLQGLYSEMAKVEFKWCTEILQIVHRFSEALYLIFERPAGSHRCDHTSHHQCLGAYPPNTHPAQIA